MQRIWKSRLTESNKLSPLINDTGMSNPCASVCVNRGLYSRDDVYGFVKPSLSKLHDPKLMKDMEIAVARIRQAINNRETIGVFGDYD